MMRTHRCGDVRAGDVGSTVTLSGWVHSRRDHGGVTFIDLRDTAGIIQVVFSPDISRDAHDAAQELRNEYCLQVRGEVRARPASSVNPKIPTGDVEVAARSIEIFSAAETPPFQVDEHQEVDEMLRLKYRYLDLRRPAMQDNLKLRHAMVSAIRRFLDGEGFHEIETPMLTRATPEGARDYLVPSRTHPGHFYALPQSPQIFKQLLMVAGLDRYYQIVRCFRDEDLRADRQPDFTQLDLEMSFVDVHDVLDVTERCFRYVWAEALNVDVAPFARLTHADALRRYGSDKPDTRFGLELVDLGEVFATTETRVFRSVLDAGGTLACIVLPGAADLSRKDLDALVQEARSLGAGGLVWVALARDGLRSPLDKFFSDEERTDLVKVAQANEGDLILIVADARRALVQKVLGALRVRLAERFRLVPDRKRSDPEAWSFVWITDFPWFEWDEEAQRWGFVHHPFTGIAEDTMQYLESDPGKVMSKAYDITLNGWELASGSIRIHDRDTQRRVFNALGISDDEAEERFGFLLTAFRFGVPPHGGIAPGIDRLVALAAGESNIREVIAFPKTQSAFDPLTGAPSEVDEEQLELLHIRSTAPPRTPS
ncbi:MAG: aspartate--tRNA ligase [Actinomycetota bacterium]